jgi:hypothetical protein
MCPLSIAMCAEWKLEGTLVCGTGWEGGNKSWAITHSLQHEFSSSVSAPMDPMASDLRWPASDGSEGVRDAVAGRLKVKACN